MERKPHKAFDFGRPVYFPDGQIATGVITPLVAQLKKNDYGRVIEGPGESFHDAEGEYDGSNHEVMLITESTEVPQGHGCIEGHSTQLIVTKRIQDTEYDLLNDGPTARELVLKGAKAAALEKYRSLDIKDEDGNYVWPGGLEDLFDVSTEQYFFFDQQGLIHQSSARVVQGEATDDVVRYAFDDKPNSPDYKSASSDAVLSAGIGVLMEHMIALEAACKLLGAPEDSIKELQRIKANPTDIY